MKQIELYIPLTDNAGQRIPQKCWTWLSQSLVQHFGGFSAYVINGVWKDSNGNIVPDNCRVYRVLVEDESAEETWIKPIAETVGRYWKQETVLYTVVEAKAFYV